MLIIALGVAWLAWGYEPAEITECRVGPGWRSECR